MKRTWKHLAFPLELKRKGYDSHGNRYGVDPDRHLMHIENDTPAIALEAVQWWSRNRVHEIVVHLTDGRRMATQLGEFIADSHEMKYLGYGRQLVAPNAWTMLAKTG